ncbi:DgyrCDS4325 [Dimorphilus gyrociliatus]|uniref:DgyrCDS4325 n=1 Tax=Dimorphilus gyrociliatus TaxID=2664684 RepID=A0A7I8VJA3_9ANNE|nr:DgyrCDS4325 [Dimorphilus gyrociliatus]
MNKYPLFKRLGQTYDREKVFSVSNRLMRRIHIVVALFRFALSSEVFIDMAMPEWSKRSSDIPIFAPMRRRLSTFVPGRTATVTLAFRCSSKPSIMWHFSTLARNTPYSPIDKLLPIIGDKNIQLNSLSAGNVHVQTLKIHKLPKQREYSFCTVFSFLHPYAISYLIYTTVQLHQPIKFEELDSVYWLKAERTAISFSNNLLKLDFTVVLDSDANPFIDEFYTISHEEYPNYEAPRSNRQSGLSQYKVKVNEDDGRMKTYGAYQKIKFGFSTYNLSKMFRKINNNLFSLSAIMKRSDQDKTINAIFFKHDVPKIYIEPCESSNSSLRVCLTRTTPTCFRCKVFGYPEARLKVSRIEGKKDLESYERVYSYQYVNVIEGAIEKVFVLRKVEKIPGGKYTCEVYDKVSDKFLTGKEFRITIVERTMTCN